MGYIEDIRALVGHRPLILCGSLVAVYDRRGRVLLQQRVHPEGSWGLPGGLMELAESTEQTARRELMEETSLALGALELIGVYSGADRFVVAPNGDEFYVVTAAYRCREYTGEARVHDDESISLAWFDPGALPKTLLERHAQILRDDQKTLPG